MPDAPAGTTEETTPTAPAATAPAAPAPAAAPATPAPTNEPDLSGAANPDAVKKILAEARKAQRDAEAQAKAAQKQVEEFQDKERTELEKANAKAEREGKRAEDLERRLLRTEVAGEKNLPPALRDRLSGSTREEMEADADALLAAIGQVAAPSQPASQAAGATPGGWDGGVRQDATPDAAEAQGTSAYLAQHFPGFAGAT